jgi:UDP-N-acetylmuramate: L-alanyl-gamma-D-glutamyl-meso-diaminopimelate ligase
MEICGEANGVTVIDDFAHHPTAIRETLLGLRSRFPLRRVWAIVEPRSATMRRIVNQNELVEALQHADASVIADLYSPEKIPPDQRLSPGKVVEALKKLGKTAEFVKTADEIVRFCVERAHAGDVVTIFSNGAFDHIHEKLLAALEDSSVSQ